jgi:16S rRNA U516 pseudouridylate synthase RsuA-like enzyme
VDKEYKRTLTEIESYASRNRLSVTVVIREGLVVEVAKMLANDGFTVERCEDSSLKISW